MDVHVVTFKEFQINSWGMSLKVLISSPSSELLMFTKAWRAETKNRQRLQRSRAPGFTVPQGPLPTSTGRPLSRLLRGGPAEPRALRCCVKQIQALRVVVLLSSSVSRCCWPSVVGVDSCRGCSVSQLCRV